MTDPIRKADKRSQKGWSEAKARMPKFSPIEQRYLNEHYVGRLATATKNGIPHVAAVCYASDEELLYIDTDYESKKGRNIQRNNRVAFIVDEYISWEKTPSYLIAEGEAAFKTGGPLFEKGRELIYAKYPKWEKEYPIAKNKSHILVIKPTKIIGWNLPKPNQSGSP